MKKSTVIVLLVFVVVISVFPLVSLGVIGSDAEFGGADGMAEGVIAEIAPDYQPWFASIYEPASGEIESLLFALQAALGAGLIGYYLGSRGGRRSEKST
ncbi:MAG: cobalt/nickel transport system permease protein [Clostridiales bacterium]|jgi:cobalt/nickel transport protein|nr:cobalt/nickel transport system permease protein [Clostridiales bacterium]